MWTVCVSQEDDFTQRMWTIRKGIVELWIVCVFTENQLNLQEIVEKCTKFALCDLFSYGIYVDRI